VDIFDLDQALIERYESFARSFSEIRAPEIRAQVDAAALSRCLQLNG